MKAMRETSRALSRVLTCFLLMMVLIPFHRVEEIRSLVVKKHPEAVYDGTWPSEHVIFP